jgi:hypothetical protein
MNRRHVLSAWHRWRSGQKRGQHKVRTEGFGHPRMIRGHWNRDDGRRIAPIHQVQRLVYISRKP